MNEHVKPPFGVMPRWRHEELRIIDLAQAIARYADVGLFKNSSIQLWADELQELVTRQTNRQEVCTHPAAAPAGLKEQGER